MEKRVIGNLVFTVHNNRESLLVRDIQWQVENITRIITDPKEYFGDESYTDYDINVLLKYKLHYLGGCLHSAYYIDMLPESCFIYNEDDFRKYFA